MYASSAKAWGFKVSQPRQHGKTLCQMKEKKKTAAQEASLFIHFLLYCTQSPLKPGFHKVPDYIRPIVASHQITQKQEGGFYSLLFDSCTPTSTPHIYLCWISKVHWKLAQPPLMNSHTRVSIRPHPLAVSFYPANCFLTVSIRVSSKQIQR